MKKMKMGSNLTAPSSRQVTLPERVCMDVGHEHPECFKLLDSVRQNPLKFRLPGKWSPWCFAPVNVAAGALGRIHQDEYTDVEAEAVFSKDTRLLCACAGWRMTKSVYVFDEVVLRSLVDSQAKDGIPDELFLRLPDWCPYIATPGLRLLNGIVLHGFFVYVDDHSYGTQKQHPPELCFSLLVDPKLSDDSAVLGSAMSDPRILASLCDEMGSKEEVLERVRAMEYTHSVFTVDLGLGTFRSGFEHSHERSSEAGKGWQSVVRVPDAGELADAQRVGYVTQKRLQSQLEQSLEGVSEEEVASVKSEVTQVLLQLASIALYLCSEEPDVEPKGFHKNRQNAMDEERRLKRAFPAKNIRSWNVGFRIGSEIRRWEASETAGGATGSGSRMRPHVRRAHWHTFVAGPRDNPERQVRRIKWLPPMPINAQGADDLVPTVKPVAAGREESR